MPKRDVGRSMSLTSQESYSAVIIADMVAEVQNQSDFDSSHQKNNSNTVRRSSSAKSEVIHRKGSTRNKKEETNLGYDGPQTESSPAAIVNVDAMETVSLGKSNGTDITKGVILNAQLDHKLGSDFLNGGGKAIELKSVADGKDAKEVVSPDFKNMSVLRRIAFAASFLPSIMFVLCFAVILPCEKKMPCVEEMWTTTLNNTNVTSGLKFPGSIVFSYSQEGAVGLQGFNVDTGILSWEDTLPSPPGFVECAHLISNDTQSCLVSDPTGAVHFYNAQTGDQLLRWDPTNGVADAPTPSLPTLLPDCDGDGITEVVVAVSPSRFALFKGFTVYTVEVPGRCDHMPERLLPWTTQNGTDLVFTCRNGTNEHLVRVSQEKWCVSLKKNKGKGEIVTLDTRSSGSLSESLIVPAGDGIVVWSEEEVTMIEMNGRKRWTMSTQEHNNKNRFLLYGKFNKTDSQVALFSSDILTSLQVSTLSSESGGSIWNRSIPNAEISDVSLIRGAEKDFALVVMKKIERDLADQAVTQLNEVSTSILNLLAKEEVGAKRINVTSSTSVAEQISLMELNGDFAYNVQDTKTTFSKGAAFSSSIAVIPEQTKEAKELSIVVLRKPMELTSELSTQLKRVNVRNWDISMSQNKQCIAGTFK